jgi:hypothetical protein
MFGHRHYAVLLTVLMIGFALGFGLWARGIEPLWGDLAIIGWRSENDYGWTQAKQRFDPLVAEIGKYDQHYDIVAIGDSFTRESSERPGTNWPHFLARDTGLEVGVFDLNDDPLNKLLDSPAFRADPPPVVIYEIVERFFLPQQPAMSPADCPAEQATPHPGLIFKPSSSTPLPMQRPVALAPHDLPVTYGVAYFLHNLVRWATGYEMTKSVALDLTQSGLFSSRDDRSLLVYSDDLKKKGWTEDQWRDAGCYLLRMQQRVQANGRTLFLAMVPPDKLTAYGPYLEDESLRNLSKLDALATFPGLHLVAFNRQNFDPAAHVDLYWPDDTHWSSVGQALAARLVEQKLQALATPDRAAEAEAKSASKRWHLPPVPAAIRPVQPRPPAGVAHFPDGLMAPGLLFVGVSQDGWLQGKAEVRLSLAGSSDVLHLTGEIPDFSPKTQAGAMTITVDGAKVLAQPEAGGRFDLVVPIPPAEGTRSIKLDMTGTDTLPPPDGRLVSLRLSSISLEDRPGVDPAP